MRAVVVQHTDALVFQRRLTATMTALQRRGAAIIDTKLSPVLNGTVVSLIATAFYVGDCDLIVIGDSDPARFRTKLRIAVLSVRKDLIEIYRFSGDHHVAVVAHRSQLLDVLDADADFYAAGLTDEIGDDDAI